MGFFESYLGMFVFQSVVHSVITIFLIERSIEIWAVRSPLGKFRYRLSVIALPVFMFPLFQFINPDRGDFYFREASAIFDGRRWLELELLGGFPAGMIFFWGTVILTSSVVFVQEIVPIIKDSLPGRKGYPLMPAGPGVQSVVDELAAEAEAPRPEVWLIEGEEHPVIFTSGAKRPAIMLSEPLLDMLDERQLRSALAHELAHILRRSNITTFLAFLFRIIMFYNPVSLIAFRRLVQDDEHVCDDITVSITKDPASLASTLRAFYTPSPEGRCRPKNIKETIESSSHNLLLEERITRLEDNRAFGDNTFGWTKYMITMTAIAAINYFVV